MRKKLKYKILIMYKSITNFCKVTGYSRVQISYILSGKLHGSTKFWLDMQKALELTDAEVLQCQRDILKTEED